jgi:hypothetical protein
MFISICLSWRQGDVMRLKRCVMVTGAVVTAVVPAPTAGEGGGNSEPETLVVLSCAN